MALEIVEFADASEWDAFVTESSQGSIFCDSRFLGATGVEFETLAVGDGGRPEAAALVVLDGNVPRRAPGPYSVYQGVLLSQSVSALASHRRLRRSLDLVSYLIEALAERYPRVSLCLHPALSDVRPFSWFHYHEPELGQFEIEVNYTAIVDLDDEGDREESLARARTVRRQDYRRAVREGFSVEEVDDVATLLRLYCATFARQNIEPAQEDLALVESIAGTALSQEFGRLFASRAPDGAIASMALFLYHAGTGYYLFGATDPDMRRTGAGTQVLFEAMWRSRDLGARRVDVVGVNSPQRGDYKTSFGAELAPYFVVNWERPHG